MVSYSSPYKLLTSPCYLLSKHDMSDLLFTVVNKSPSNGRTSLSL